MCLSADHRLHQHGVRSPFSQHENFTVSTKVLVVVYGHATYEAIPHGTPETAENARLRYTLRSSAVKCGRRNT